MITPALLLTALALAAPASPPAPPRYAVVVGANAAAPGRRPLRFARADAEAVASVLVASGRFPPRQVTVLLDRPPAEVLAALDARLAEAAAAPEALVVFYYSGHADEDALYPAGQPLPVGALRARLDRASASVRLGIVDACGGGGWTRAKGMTAGAPVLPRPPLELGSEGSALLASSSGGESAHESEALEGSFFTHHLVAGLRGAADRDGDGAVTLDEVFAYARELTVRDTSLQAEAPQHPSFQKNLRGRGDLELARVDDGAAVLALAQTQGPIQVLQLSTGLMVLELPQGPRHARLTLEPGRYLVRTGGPEGIRGREVLVRAGAPVAVDEASLVLVPAPTGEAKAWEPPRRPGEGQRVALIGQLGGLSSLRLQVFPYSAGVLRVAIEGVLASMRYDDRWTRGNIGCWGGGARVELAAPIGARTAFLFSPGADVCYASNDLVAGPPIPPEITDSYVVLGGTTFGGVYHLQLGADLQLLHQTVAGTGFLLGLQVGASTPLTDRYTKGAKGFVALGAGLRF